MIVAETWLGAALNRVWCAPGNGSEGTLFYLLCLTAEPFVYCWARVSTPVTTLDEIETKVHGSGCATDAKYHAAYLADSTVKIWADREDEKGVASRGMSRNTYLAVRFPVEQPADMSV